MPSGGDGFYYFSTYLLVDNGKWGEFSIEINGEVFCASRTDQTETPNDEGQTACSAATYATEGWSIYLNMYIQVGNG